MGIDEIIYEVFRGWIRAKSANFFIKKYQDQEKTTQCPEKPKGGSQKSI
jgi:hypothetical protein